MQSGLLGFLTQISGADDAYYLRFIGAGSGGSWIVAGALFTDLTESHRERHPSFITAGDMAATSPTTTQMYTETVSLRRRSFP